MSLGTDEEERHARLFSRGNREKNFPEISDVEEGVGKHRRDIPGKMIIRSWKNFGTSEREEEREKGKEREGRKVAETKQQFLAMSPLRAHLSWNCFRQDTIFTMSNCWLSLGRFTSLSHRTILFEFVSKHGQTCIMFTEF